MFATHSHSGSNVFKGGLSRILSLFQICYICVALDAYCLEKILKKNFLL